MIKFKSWLYRTFTGIYGIDKLYFVLFGLCFALVIVNAFARFWPLYIVEVAIFVLMVLRMMSHNITARRRENDAFFGFFKKISAWFRLQRNRFKDRKTHIYRKCPDCRATLRLPKAKGKHTVVCPRCKKRFNVKG